MSAHKSFKQILNDKLKTAHSEAESPLKNAWSAPLYDLKTDVETRLWTRPRLTLKHANRVGKTYPARPARPKVEERTHDKRSFSLEKDAIPSVDTSPKCQVKDLGTEEKKALERWLGWGATLMVGEEISLTRLKKSYRQLARRFHPDGQSTEASPDLFLKLHTDYLLLMQTFTKAQSKAHPEVQPKAAA